MSTQDTTLPPLPEPDHALDCGDQPFYRPDQMQAYARIAIAAQAQQASDWRIPTTELQRMSDTVTLLCSGNRPSDEMVSSWLDCSSDDLQDFAATYGPAWAQGIGLLDAARIMIDQPTEGVDHAFSKQAKGIPAGYALVKVRDEEHRRQLIGDAIFSEPVQQAQGVPTLPDNCKNRFFYPSVGDACVFDAGGGWPYQVEDAKKKLLLGSVYKVTKVEVHSSHTRVWIEGHGDWFNNMLFRALAAAPQAEPEKENQ